MIQTLISSGHRWPDIQDYTLAQVVLFHKTAVRLRGDERAGKVMDRAVSFHAKPQDRSQYCKALTK